MQYVSELKQLQVAGCLVYNIIMFTIVGLGNPGEEYKNTRHNTGRIILQKIAKDLGFSEWREEGKIKALMSEGKINKEKTQFVMPNNFMNNSGKSIVPIIKSKKDLANLIVIYDDLDLPIGKIKISFNKSSGGHRGLESIIKNVKSLEFTRIRIGTSPVTPSGKIKKPVGEKAVEKWILGEFKDKEINALKKISKMISEALEVIIVESKEKAMSLFN